MDTLSVALVHRDLHDPTRGGIGTIYRELAARLAARGLNVHLITQNSDSPLQLPGVSTHLLPRTEDLRVHGSNVARTLRALRPDVAEASSWEAELLELLDGGTQNDPAVVIRGDLSALTMRARPDLIEREQRLMAHRPCLVGVSRFATQDLQRAYGHASTRVIYNGVDTHHFSPSAPKGPLSVSTVILDGQDAVVGPRRVYRNASQLWPRRPGMRVLWIGKRTPMKGWDRLQQLIGLNPMLNFLLLLGHSPALSEVSLTGREANVRIVQGVPQADLPALYSSADALISTSRWEGFGLAMAESLACGTPIVVPTDLEVAQELLVSGGGTTYTSNEELQRALEMVKPISPAVPTHMTWDACTTATLDVYLTQLRR